MIKIENCDPNSLFSIVVDFMSNDTQITTPLQTHILTFGDFVLVDLELFKNLRVTRST